VEYLSGIKLWRKESEVSQKLEAILGVGPITASAIVATAGNAREFKSSRQLVARLGLVLKQHSGGSKQTITWHQQTCRHLPAHFANSWGTSGHSLCEKKRLRQKAGCEN
jgi:transposase